MATPSFRSRSQSHNRFAQRLIIMVKEPRAGRVKTRLARSAGVVAATAVYRKMLADLVARLGHDCRWQTTLAVSPDAELASLMLPSRANRVAQGGGNLGHRMQSICDRALRGPMVIVGTDIPSITFADVADAFRLLGSHDAVVGPSGDGGYWLIGLRRRPCVPRAFANVRWSSANARADTEANLRNLSVAYLRRRDDVDDGVDLARQRALIGRRILQSNLPASCDVLQGAA